MGLDNLDQNYYDKNFPGNNHPWENTQPIQNRNQLSLDMYVYHRDVYNGKERLKVVGIRKDTVELEGDYSGGTHGVNQKSWLSLDGILI